VDKVRRWNYLNEAIAVQNGLRIYMIGFTSIPASESPILYGVLRTNRFDVVGILVTIMHEENERSHNVMAGVGR
jgi:hypothetical protein